MSDAGTLSEHVDSNVYVAEVPLLRFEYLSKAKTICWLAVVALLLSATQAYGALGPSLVAPDSRTLKVQRKVDSLYERGEFERAYFIYRNELAPLGDKYAQYMVGFMHLTGQGAVEDNVLASAWYRLAAERGHPEFVAVRRQVLEALNESELAHSDRLFLELRQQYSDLVLMIALLERDFEELRSAPTGSRLSGRSSIVTVVDPRSGSSMSGDVYDRQIRRRVQSRLDYITERLGIERRDADRAPKNLDELGFEVEDYLRRINDR